MQLWDRFFIRAGFVAPYKDFVSPVILRLNETVTQADTYIVVGHSLGEYEGSFTATVWHEHEPPHMNNKLAIRRWRCQDCGRQDKQYGRVI